VKRGLEVTGLAAIDVNNHTGFHLEAVQTIIKDNDNRSLSEVYADIITRRKERVETEGGHGLYTAIVYSVSLERNVRLVHLGTTNGKGKNGYKLYFCTNTEMDATLILKYYQSHFQIEFLYWGAKHIQD